MGGQTTQAIIFVASQYMMPDAPRCMDYCRARGYRWIGVVQDDWHKAMEYLQNGKAHVLVVADERHLDPERTPRIEVVAEAAARAGSNERRFRTSRINRPSAGA